MHHLSESARRIWKESWLMAIIDQTNIGRFRDAVCIRKTISSISPSLLTSLAINPRIAIYFPNHVHRLRLNISSKQRQLHSFPPSRNPPTPLPRLFHALQLPLLPYQHRSCPNPLTASPYRYKIHPIELPPRTHAHTLTPRHNRPFSFRNPILSRRRSLNC